MYLETSPEQIIKLVNFALSEKDEDTLAKLRAWLKATVGPWYIELCLSGGNYGHVGAYLVIQTDKALHALELTRYSKIMKVKVVEDLYLQVDDVYQMENLLKVLNQLRKLGCKEVKEEDRSKLQKVIRAYISEKKEHLIERKWNKVILTLATINTTGGDSNE